MVVAGVMALVTVLVNVLVILVIDSYPNSCSRQLMLKKSLAVADLICGLLVLPTFVSTVYLRFVAQRKVIFHTDSMNASSEQHTIFSNQTASSTSHISLPFNNENAYEANVTTLLEETYPRWYLPFAGFFVSLTMMASLYTLLFSNVDQFSAVRRPIAVSETYALRLSKFLLILPWIVATAFSLLPIFIATLRPYEVITGLVIGRGRYALLFYCLTFLLPFVLAWLVNLLSWFLVKKNEKHHNVGSDSEGVQKKQVGTLTEMTALFTICVLPAGIAILIHIVYHDNDVNNIISHRYYDFELIGTLILLSKGIWFCFLYNIRSEAFRFMTGEKIKAIWYSCCCYQCCRNAQADMRKIRRRFHRLF